MVSPCLAEVPGSGLTICKTITHISKVKNQMPKSISTQIITITKITTWILKVRLNEFVLSLSTDINTKECLKA